MVGPNAKSAFLQETKDKLSRQQSGYDAEMQAMKMETQNYQHEKWHEKGLREKELDLSPQSQLLLNAR